MTIEAMKLYRMKPNCVVRGVSWWSEEGSYYGQDIGGGIQTVRLWNSSGSDSIEVLRGSVVELPGRLRDCVLRPEAGSGVSIDQSNKH